MAVLQQLAKEPEDRVDRKQRLERPMLQRRLRRLRERAKERDRLASKDEHSWVSMQCSCGSEAGRL